MQIQRISFGHAQTTNYENPINRKTEKGLAVLSSVGVSTLVGGTAAGLTTCMTKGWKLPAFIGVGVAALCMALNLPAKLYNTSVNAFAREKEMDVFSRQKAAQASIYSGLNEQIADSNVSLEEKIKNYSTVALADQGKGVMIKGA